MYVILPYSSFKVFEKNAKQYFNQWFNGYDTVSELNVAEFPFIRVYAETYLEKEHRELRPRAVNFGEHFYTSYLANSVFREANIEPV